MKRMKSVGVVLAFSLGLVAVAACKHPQQSNWRSPAPAPMPCASDADCGGAQCTIEMGASQGTCAPVGGAAPMHGGDAGSGPHLGPAGPDVRPSPNDIQI